MLCDETDPARDYSLAYTRFGNICWRRTVSGTLLPSQHVENMFIHPVLQTREFHCLKSFEMKGERLLMLGNEDSQAIICNFVQPYCDASENEPRPDAFEIKIRQQLQGHGSAVRSIAHAVTPDGTHVGPGEGGTY